MFRAVFVVMNAAMGAGILNFPQAFGKAGGITAAMSIELVMLVFITGSFVIMAYCANMCGSRNYQEIVRDMLGTKAYLISEVFVLLYMLGSSIAYLILIADQLEQGIIGKALVPGDPWYVSRTFLLCTVTIVFILPLCIPKTMGILSYTSTAGSLGVLYVCFVAAYKYFSGSYNPSKIQPHVEKPWTELFGVIPIICFGFMCHVPALSVYTELKRPTVPRFGIVCTIAMVLCCTAYSVTACFGFLTFGAKCKSDILMNYSSNDVMVNIARVAIALVVISTFASVHFSGRSAVEGLWLTAWRMTLYEAEINARKRRVVQTVLWVGFTLFIAVAVSDISYVISIIGGLAALFILFFPGMCPCLFKEIMRHRYLTHFQWALLFTSIFYIVMGVFLFGESEVLAITEDLKPKNLY
ncbi:predicted protein [Nematostella vectensis]|uniref:Amino acid transporter transmembrane domain-containing protein n=2 Tax=Nematostella vectensis TaxID=45351 RepID=A7SUS1_NEMVE|nr:predicted protein [Nematostella vectensis]|eukprot:XP_001624630.1 predicted protein [Nematostella vectensis]